MVVKTASRAGDHDERTAARLGEAVSGVRLAHRDDGSGAPVHPAVGAAIDRVHDGGAPLGPVDRGYFEPRFGADFGRVRLHGDRHAASLAAQVRASAFTRGTQVFLGPGWTTATDTARKGLLGHELAHVREQMGRPTPERIQRAPGPGETVARVDIYLGSGAIRVTTATGATYRLVLRRDASLNLDPTPPGQPYKSTHVRGVTPDTIASPTAQDWRYEQPESGGFDLTNSPSGTYDLHVHEALRPDEGTGTAGTGTKEGEGSGDRGTGTGEKGKGGDAASGTSVAKAEGKLDAFKARLKQAGVEGTGADGGRLEALLERLDARAVDDFLEFLKDASTGDDALDFEALAEQYGKLTPSERELLRVNRLLARDDAQATDALPEDVQLALTAGADATADVSTQMDALNDDLARIRDAVAPDSLAAKDPTALDPIELSKLPAFNEMMMLQGLLAGASQRSPEVQATSKELMGTIGALRSHVLEEIAWMTAEMAVGAIFAALLAPVSAGASTVLAGARATALLVRLNRLRKFLQTVERVYSTYQYVESAVVNVTRLMQGYAAFKAQYDSWMAEWEALEARLDAPDLHEAVQAELTQKLEDLEDRLVEELMRLLESDTGLGSLLETFAIPEGTSEDELRRILMDLPRGVEALRDLASYYGSGVQGDVEYTRTLAFKATAAGYLLYPFVGHLAMQVTNQLGALMAEKDLGDRLLDILGRARAGRSRRRLPTRKESHGKLKKVRTHRQRKAEEQAAEAKADKQAADVAKQPGPKKKKGDGDPPDDAKGGANAAEDAEWARVKAKMAALRSDFGDTGATKDELLARARAIRKAHLSVAKAPSTPSDVHDRGEWRVSIDRKGLSADTAPAQVWMSIRSRWGKGVAAVQRALAGITPPEVTRDGVSGRLDGIQERYAFASLTTVPRSDRSRQGVAVRGKMGTQAEREITTVDDVRGLHTGRKDDPIPIHFYKEPGNYRRRIKLRVGSAMEDFSMVGNKSIAWRYGSKVEQVRVGVEADNVVKEGTVLRRMSRHRRTGTQQDYRDALEAAAFDWSPPGQDLDADHVLDLGFEGTDSHDNLWPLDSRVNRHAYTGRWYMDYGIVYRDPNKPTETQEDTLYRLVGRYFRVTGFATKPKRHGGRDPVKP